MFSLTSVIDLLFTGGLPSHNAMGVQTPRPLEGSPPPYDQPTGGMHPTGMHTCDIYWYVIFFFQNEAIFVQLDELYELDRIHPRMN